MCGRETRQTVANCFWPDRFRLFRNNRGSWVGRDVGEGRCGDASSLLRRSGGPFNRVYRHYDMAMGATFESALHGRVDAMIDACTRCGKYVEVCPATEPAGLSAEERQNPAEVIGGLIDLLRVLSTLQPA